MRTALLLPVLALLAGLALSLPTSTSAQSPEFTTAIENDFPQFLRFRLTVSAPGEVADVTLRYRVTGSGSLARAKPEEFQPAAEVRVEVRVPTGTLGFIPVGSEFVYHWELTLDDGTVLESESDSYVYLPPGREWQSVHNDFMRVYYHGNLEDTALALLAAAERTYARMGELLRTELEVVPVSTVLFASEADLEGAQPTRSEAYDAATFLCGSQVANNVIFVLDRSCGTRDRADTLRHEFTHILTKAAGESALGKIPSWLDEGTAVYSQTEPGSGYLDAFEVGVAIDRLIPFKTMIAGNYDPNLVGLFYGQSYQMVRFLIRQGGEDTFARLFATIKAGNRFDRAIESVYGWTIEEFENEFRAFHDLPPREPAPTVTPAREEPASTPEPTPAPERPEPTPSPTTAPEQAEPDPTVAASSAPRSSSGGDGGRELSSVALGAIAGGAVLALLAIFAFLLSLMLGNRGQEPAPAGDAPEDPAPSGPLASSSRGSTFDASSRSEEPPSPEPEAEPEPEPEFDEWGPPPRVRRLLPPGRSW